MSSNPLNDILGSVLGMGTGSATNTQTQQSDPLGGILGSILGGGSSPIPQQNPMGVGTGGIGDILGSVLGGGLGSGGMGTSMEQSISNVVAQKLGIPPVIAYMIVTFVIGKLLSNASAQKQPVNNMGRLVQQMNSADYLHSSGMSNELAAQVGVKPQMATDAMQAVLGALMGSMKK